MKSLILLLFSFLVAVYPLSLIALSELYPERIYPELTELLLDTYELESWSPALVLDVNRQERPTFLLKSSSYWQPGQEQAILRHYLATTDKMHPGVPNLNSVLYQKLEKGAAPVTLSQIGLLGNSGTFLSHFALGSFRLQAGEGLCLGSFGRGNRSFNDFIKPAIGLSHPNLTGSAFQLQKFNLDLAAWLSATKRYALLQDGRISRLYESELVSREGKDLVQENCGGVIAACKTGPVRTGAYYYRQSYDHLFADSTQQSLTQAFGMFGGLQLPHNPVTWEAALIDDKLAYAMLAEHEAGKIGQQLAFYHRPQVFSLPYSRTGQVFGQQTGVEECSWDINYDPVKQFQITSRIAVFRDLAGTAVSSWKQRLAFSLLWKQPRWRTRLTYFQFSKEAIPVIDSLEPSLLPVQKRVKVDWNYSIAPGLSYHAVCQYQYYQERSFTKNGVSVQQGIAFGSADLDASLSFSAWFNQKSTYEPSELINNDEILIQADTDSAFRLHLLYAISRRLKLGLLVYHPNRHVERESCNLTLQTSL